MKNQKRALKKGKAQAAPAQSKTGKIESKSPGETGNHEVILSFSRKEWADIKKSAAFDSEKPETWLRESALLSVPETLDAIRRGKMTESQRAKEDAALALARGLMKTSPRYHFDLTPDQTLAIALCAEWEEITIARFCQIAIFSLLECSFGDMNAAATGNHSYPISEMERKWAKKWHRKAAPVLTRLGWEGVGFPEGQSVGSRGGDQ